MMTELPKIFDNLVKTLKEENQKPDIFENQDNLTIRNFQCKSQLCLNNIISLFNIIQDNLLGTPILIGQILREIEINKIKLEKIQNDDLTISINKNIKEYEFYFLTTEGLKNGLKDLQFAASSKIVRVNSVFQEFYTISTKFIPWGETNNFLEYDWKGIIDPKRLVRDLSYPNEYKLTYDVRFWILRPNQKLNDSTVLKIWKTEAAKNIALLLPNEINMSIKPEKIFFKGEKIKEVEIHDFDDKYIEYFQLLHDAAEWVYSNIQDSETKHYLLNYHLAYEWTTEKKWPDIDFIQRAIISAKEAFRLHLQSSSKELLKSFNEIKKSLFEEVIKISSNTHSLITNLWRDFTIAGAVLVLKFLVDSSKISQTGIKILFTAVSIFLIISLSITIYINSRFNRIAKENRNKWQKKLYTFIDKDNLENLVNKPIKKGITTYYITLSIIIFIYIILVVGLFYLAYCKFNIF